MPWKPRQPGAWAASLLLVTWRGLPVTQDSATGTHAHAGSGLALSPQPPAHSRWQCTSCSPLKTASGSGGGRGCTRAAQPSSRQARAASLQAASHPLLAPVDSPGTAPPHGSPPDTCFHLQVPSPRWSDPQETSKCSSWGWTPNLGSGAGDHPRPPGAGDPSSRPPRWGCGGGARLAQVGVPGTTAATGVPAGPNVPCWAGRAGVWGHRFRPGRALRTLKDWSQAQPG